MIASHRHNLPSDAELLTQRRERVACVIGELFRPAVYWLFTSNGVPETVGIPGCRGCTGRTLDVRAMPWLESQGQWAGRRPAVFIDDVGLLAQIRDESPDQQDVPSVYVNVLQAIAMHEVAHIIDKGVGNLEPPTPQLNRFAELIYSYSAERTTNNLYPAWDGHGLNFLRIAMHLCYKANWLGFPVELVWVFNSSDYGLSHPYDYWRALLPELVMFADVPACDMSAVTPPAPCLDLWRRDLIAWRSTAGMLISQAESEFQNDLALFAN